MLEADCDLSLPQAEDLLARFCTHFTEHAAVRRRGSVGRIAMPYGRFRIHAADSRFQVRVRADDETNLTYVKMGVVHQLRAFVGETLPAVRWSGDGMSGGVPAFWREMRVVRAFDVTPAMRRVVLAGADLARFAVGGLHVRLFFPPAGRALRGPVLGEDGTPVWPAGEDALTPRVYTIRAIDPERGEVAIDILRHDGDLTPGSAFAVGARAGDVVGMAGPLGDARVPAQRRLFLFGDETAIPAIDRILSRLPETAAVTAVVEVAGPQEEQRLASAAALDLVWLHRGASGRSLADAARALTPEMVGGDSYVWAACEYADFAAIRQHCRGPLGLKRDRHHVVAYWRRGAASE